MSLNRQFPLKYTSSILISLLELGPPFTPQSTLNHWISNQERTGLGQLAHAGGTRS